MNSTSSSAVMRLSCGAPALTHGLADVADRLKPKVRSQSRMSAPAGSRHGSLPAKSHCCTFAKCRAAAWRLCAKLLTDLFRGKNFCGGGDGVVRISEALAQGVGCSQGAGPRLAGC